MRTVQYQRIADELRQQITGGHLAPGERLPSEQQLASTYRVGVPTVRQATTQLEAEGLVDKRHGRGTFVRAQQPRTQYRDDRHAWTEWKPTPAHTTHRTVRRREADRPLSALLAVPLGTPITECRYTTNTPDRAPHIVVHAYVLPDLLPGPGPATAPDPWADDLHRALTTAGIELATVTERLTARPPTADEAQAMNLPGGVALLEITRTTTDTTGRIITAARLHLAGDRTEAIFSRPAPQPN
ncbi:GntR family transcriptional regulator [Streptomyces sp. 3MP-14]|uniref:GntR family transcriptional regulator n=1 Tax=Streptomyces mimosae TaxID=2586635 RepID=A0A5N6AQZ6_9ACTN|nr:MULTISPECIES: GntR family transcriptional regulator [Streptomyces]KAB8171111.1 GntR family transcriptional regulator [Streptomyces mimosae]KAB8179537.1 GntR family transcriptional regulator [Streptomyces sp. 3MP-14]